MSWFKNMDLYKGIILLSIVLIPVALYFVYWVDNRIADGRAAIARAEGPKGELAKIAAIRTQLQTVNKNSNVARREDHRGYFESRIMNSAESGLRKSDFTIGDEIRKGAGKNAQDKEVQITFARDRKSDSAWERDFIGSMLFNCESGGARIWKLRTLSLRNAEAGGSRGSKSKIPPKTVADTWIINKLLFARREPAEKRR